MRIALAALLAALAACSFQPAAPPTDLVNLRATWFSYLDAADIRASCAAGGPVQVRLVYNADYRRQARAYDLMQLPDGSWHLRQVVDRGIGFAPDRSLAEAFAPTIADRRLSPAEGQELIRRLEQTGAFSGAGIGERLDARAHYWLVSGCRGGVATTSAFTGPDPAFAPLVAAYDSTGVAWPRPTTADADAGRSCPRDRDDTDICFTLQVGRDGLVGF